MAGAGPSCVGSVPVGWADPGGAINPWSSVFKPAGSGLCAPAGPAIMVMNRVRTASVFACGHPRSALGKGLFTVADAQVAQALEEAELFV